MQQNVELKARLADLASARHVADKLGAEFLGVLDQRDTYFEVPNGRLKLREIAGAESELIGYDRADVSGSRTSRYRIVRVPDAPALCATLEAALGVRAVIVKRRVLYRFRNVRIHLDEVADLGTFLEFEAVLEPHDSEADARGLLAELQQRFEIRDADLIGGSYLDLSSV